MINSIFALAVLAASVGWMFTLRPISLGGPASYVMIRGVSMLPAFHPGDLVIARRQGSYTPGDIVVYRVPAGQTGQGILVAHRIIAGSATTGFVLKGDNNPDPDEWQVKSDDILGKAWIAVPWLGLALAFLRSPLPLACLAAGIAVALVVDAGRSKARSRTSTGAAGKRVKRAQEPARKPVGAGRVPDPPGPLDQGR